MGFFDGEMELRRIGDLRKSYMANCFTYGETEAVFTNQCAVQIHGFMCLKYRNRGRGLWRNVNGAHDIQLDFFRQPPRSSGRCSLNISEVRLKSESFQPSTGEHLGILRRISFRSQCLDQHFRNICAGLRLPCRIEG